jgi:hypothetical protein
VEVSISNTGPAIRAEIVVSLGRATKPFLKVTRRIDLAQGAKRREWLLLPLGAASGEIRVGLYEVPDDSGTPAALLVGTPTVSYSSYSSSNRHTGFDPRVLYVSSDPYMTWSRATWAISYADAGCLGLRSPARLPDRALAYSGVDVVLLHDVDLGELSVEQRNALKEWCRAGGKIMLVPRRRLGWLRDPLLKEILGDIEISQHEVTRLPRLERRLGGLARNAADFSRVVRPDPFTVFVGRRAIEPSAAAPSKVGRRASRQIMLSERLPDGTPFDLFKEVRFGRGGAYILAVDLSAAPFDRWRFRSRLVSNLHFRMFREARSVLTPYVPPNHPSRGPNAADPHADPDLVQLLNSIEMPSRGLVILLIVVYVLCVGPINYFTLRARDRQVWIVATVPLISLVFCAGVVLAGYVSKGLGMVTWRVSVITAEFGTPGAVEHTGISLRTSQAGSYAVGFDRPLVAARVLSGDESSSAATFELRDEGRLTYPAVDLEMWQQVTFKAEALRDLGGGLTVEHLQGSIKASNQTPYGLSALVHLERPGVDRPSAGNPHRLFRLVDLGAVGSLASAVVPEGTSPRLLPKLRWDQELARALVPNAEGEDLALLEEALRAYVPCGNPTADELLVGLLKEPPSKIVVDGEAKADRELCLIIARGPGR